MAISVTLRNRLVGFTIVAATLLIFLPVLLSKEMIKRPNPDAVAVNEQGAVLDSEGNLVHQSTADTERALNLGQRGELTLSAVNSAQGTATGQPPVPPPQPTTTPSRTKTEILTAPAQGSAAQSSTAQSSTAQSSTAQGSAAQSSAAQGSAAHTEILTAAPKPAAKPQAQPKPQPAPSTEILTAAKPTPKPAANNDNVIAGTRPTQRYVIQVGVFSQRANAENVVKKITKAGYSVYAIKVNSNGRELYRVYAAQSDDRNSLNPILTRVNKLCGTKGTIINFK